MKYFHNNLAHASSNPLFVQPGGGCSNTKEFWNFYDDVKQNWNASRVDTKRGNLVQNLKCEFPREELIHLIYALYEFEPEENASLDEE